MSPNRPGLSYIQRATLSEENVTLTATSQALYATTKMVVGFSVVNATATANQVLIGFMAVPDSTVGVSWLSTPGVQYDLSQVLLKGQIGDVVNVKYAALNSTR